MCHINMLKSYYERTKTNPVLAATGPVPTPNHTDVHEEVTRKRLWNSEILADYGTQRF